MCKKPHLCHFLLSGLLQCKLYFYKGQLTFFKVEKKRVRTSEFLKTIYFALSAQTMFINKLQVRLLLAFSLISFGVWALEVCITRCAHVFLYGPVFSRVPMY